MNRYDWYDQVDWIAQRASRIEDDDSLSSSLCSHVVSVLESLEELVQPAQFERSEEPVYWDGTTLIIPVGEYEFWFDEFGGEDYHYTAEDVYRNSLSEDEARDRFSDTETWQQLGKLLGKLSILSSLETRYLLDEGRLAGFFLKDVGLYAYYKQR